MNISVTFSMKSAAPILMLTWFFFCFRSSTEFKFGKDLLNKGRALLSNRWLKADLAKGKILKNHVGQLLWDTIVYAFLHKRIT